MKQLATYFSLAYLVSWIMWLPLYGPKLGIHGLPVLPFHHALGGLGPLLASFLTTWIFDKKAGIKKLLAQCFRLRPFLYVIVALAGPYLLALLAAVISALMNHTPVNLSGMFTGKEFPQFNLLVFFLFNLVFFGYGEEVGWRGFALPRLQQQMSALSASLLLAVLWSLWHWPLFLYRAGYTGMDMAGVSGWLFSMLTGSVLLTWLYNSSGGSLLVCAIFHCTIDMVFTADVADKNIVNLLGFLVTVWGIATVIFFGPKRLVRQKTITAL